MGIDCRARSCVATLQFGSYAEALKELRTVVGFTECRSQSALDEPPDAAVPFLVTILYDCKEGDE
jgi:hypothetical protein